MKKKFYNCPSVEVMTITSYGVCQSVSLTIIPSIATGLPDPNDGI